MVWPTLGSRMAKEQNRTEQNYASVMYAVVVCPYVRPSVTSWYCMENDGMNRVGFWHRGSLIPIIHCIFKNPGTSKYFLLKLCYKDWTYKTFCHRKSLEC